MNISKAIVCPTCNGKLDAPSVTYDSNGHPTYDNSKAMYHMMNCSGNSYEE
jgi:hypothetical protein